jgi:hypothetical protein
LTFAANSIRSGFGRDLTGLLLAITRGKQTLASHEWNKSEPNRIDPEGYLSWLSLLPLRLNPIFTGRRSRAD